MLIAARSSQDFACCLRATASARSKYASAFVVSRLDGMSAISPATRLTRDLVAPVYGCSQTV
jgi:hypothetical protein